MKKLASYKDLREEIVDPMTGTIAQPGKYSERTSSVDDSNDEFYSHMDPSKMAIMRYITSLMQSSPYLIKYFNIFLDKGGLNVLEKFLETENCDQDIFMIYSKILHSLTNFLIEDVINKKGYKLTKLLIKFALNCTEKNLRDTSKEQLQELLETIENLILRMMTSSRCSRILNYILLKVFFICLNSEILEKQYFALQIFAKIESHIYIYSNTLNASSFHDHDSEESKLKNQQLQDEISLIESSIKIIKENISIENQLIQNCGIDIKESDSGFNKEKLANLIAENNIFEMIFKGHDSLIQKSSKLMKLLFSFDKINEDKLSFLWEMIKTGEFDTRSNVISMLKDSSWQINTQSILFILSKIENHIQNQPIDMDILELIIDFRRSSYSQSQKNEIYDKINDILWISINSSQISQNVFKKCLNFLIRYTVNDDSDDMNTAKTLFEKATNNITENKNFLTSLKIISKILKETKFDNYFLFNLERMNIPLKIISLLMNIKKSLDNQETYKLGEIDIPDKNNVYYSLLKKCLKFILRISKEQDDESFDIDNFFFKIWIFFMQSKNNSKTEIFEINNFISKLLFAKEEIIDPETIKFFLLENFKLLENISSEDFFKHFKMLMLIVNYKEDTIDKKEVVFGPRYFNDFDQKKINFFVLNVPSNQLFLFKELNELYFETKNALLEKYLSEFIAEIICKPDYAESMYNQIYLDEEDSLIKTLKTMYENKTSEDFSNKVFSEDMLSQEMIQRVKMLKLVQICLGKKEITGIGNIPSCATLNEGTHVMVNIERETRYQHRTSKKILLKQE